MNNTPKERPKWNKPAVAIAIIAAVVLAWALFNIISIGGGYLKSRQLYDGLLAYATIDESTAGDGSTVHGDVQNTTTSIDFATLQAINPDIIAWVYVPGTNINYPVTVGRDNQYYISHNADLSENRSGAIFMDMLNSSDFSDQNTVLYGHNMKDGSMFASLHEFEDEQFFRTHTVVYIYTPDGLMRRYTILAAYTTGAVSDTYTLSFGSQEAFEQYIAETRSKSTFTGDAAVHADSSLLTLSTCVQGQDSKRYVVVAVEDE